MVRPSKFHDFFRSFLYSCMNNSSYAVFECTLHCKIVWSTQSMLSCQLKKAIKILQGHQIYIKHPWNVKIVEGDVTIGGFLWNVIQSWCYIMLNTICFRIVMDRKPLSCCLKKKEIMDHSSLYRSLLLLSSI